MLSVGGTTSRRKLKIVLVFATVLGAGAVYGVLTWNGSLESRSNCSRIWLYLESTCIPKDSLDHLSWSETISILRNAEVKLVYKPHGSDIEFYLVDGRVVVVREPYIGALSEEFRKCGDACGRIQYVIE